LPAFEQQGGLDGQRDDESSNRPAAIPAHIAHAQGTMSGSGRAAAAIASPVAVIRDMVFDWLRKAQGVSWPFPTMPLLAGDREKLTVPI
jgi:hypothetical protein